ncbi:chemotaxis protein CheW [Marinicauda salina]|uniref:Chemotaxis protein CheW n=1 Tax=Marinicauda salina TaxID=2135793 RepID=A0A2U2BS07_9PROT|nr:chemotaxis protein CheW [Marinicauda salina]PWE16785.1 chemotaxis protein CheW [Marinicauda salina]
MSNDSTFEYVTVRIGDQLFGAAVAEIREVFSPQGVTEVPRAPAEIAGLLNLRGRIVTAIDARRRLGLPPREPDASCMALGLELGSELYGVLVDEVGEVMRLKPESMEPTPAHLDADWRALVTGVHRLEGELLAILDLNALIAGNVAATAA